MEKKLCKRCLSEMEKTLKVCPTCGAKVKMSIWKKVGIGFGIFILLGIMGSFSEDSSTATQNNSNATVNETKEKVQNEIEEKENVQNEIEEKENVGKKVKWNIKNENALENGNIEKAVKQLIGKEDITGEAVIINPVDAYKAPWDYYGTIIEISGEVELVEDYPPGSKFHEIFGTQTASNITLVTEDDVVVSLISSIPSKKINKGNMATIYGYIVGRGELVENSYGGTEKGLVVVGTQLNFY